MGSRFPTTPEVRFVPLGGLGEIGLNLAIIECGGQAVIIDAGLLFPEERAFGLGVLAPDLSYLDSSGVEILGVVLTHAHEDHVGALPHLLRRSNMRVYGTEMALAFANRRFAEAGMVGARMTAIEPRRPFDLGPFTIEPIRVTHSTPDSVALAIRTPAGLIVHSGDFKIDPAPVDGELFDTERFRELGAEGVMLLLSDSTNVERPGRAGSETSLRPLLKELAAKSRGKFVLSVFSSHIHRIRQVAEVAIETGRRVVALGRRVSESVRIGIELGQLAMPPATFIDPGEAEFLESRRLAYVASGSQGEPLSAMAKLAVDAHPRLSIGRGDTVVLSSRFIPGNERTIHTLVNRLHKRGADIYYDGVAPVHVSGHACRDELTELIRILRPRYFVPIHGEYRHLSRHRALAAEAGVAEANCFLLEDGDPLILANGEAHRTRSVAVGRVFIEGGEFGDPSLLSERRTLAQEGTVFVVLAVSSITGEVVSGPDLISRGLVSGDGTSVHMKQAAAELRARLRRLDRPLRGDSTLLREEMVRALRHYFQATLKRRPMIVAHVVEV